MWTALCLVLGGLVGWQTWQLREVTRGLDDAGAALERTGRVLERMSDLPVVGRDIADAGEEVSATGERAGDAAEAGRRRVAGMALMLGLAIGLLPSVPVLFLWRAFRHAP